MPCRRNSGCSGAVCAGRQTPRTYFSLQVLCRVFAELLGRFYPQLGRKYPQLGRKYPQPGANPKNVSNPTSPSDGNLPDRLDFSDYSLDNSYRLHSRVQKSYSNVFGVWIMSTKSREPLKFLLHNLRHVMNLVVRLESLFVLRCGSHDLPPLVL